ncbi:MAG TPA: leishmanolysin-related zinc metalloendopeptidase [Gemmatimonadales bacterium]
MCLTRPLAVLALLGTTVFGCKSTSDPETPVPTSLSVSAPTVELAALGATASVTASVKDQDGAALTSETITWTSADPSVATVSGSATGTITAVANGTTKATVTSGSLSAEVTVTVTQVATQIVKISGDAQSGAVGDPLSQPLVAEQRDARGNPVPGGTGGLVANSVMSFAVAAGGGSMDPTSATVGTDGRASSTWTLGSAAGPQTVTASRAGGGASVTFGATATAGPADSLYLVLGDDQAGPAGAPLPDSLLVRVVDAFGNPFAGHPVAFEATTGGGATSDDTVLTDVSGRAGVIWTLGPAAGAQTATATAAGLKGSPYAFDATALVPDSMAVAAGDGQVGAINAPLDDSIVVVVLDQFGDPFPGHPVAFEVTTGGGAVSDDTVLTDASGRAGVIWTLGGTVGPQTATAAAVGVTKGSPAVFTATGVQQIATTLAKVAGDGLVGLVGKPTNIPPAVKVEDQTGNPMAGVGVTFTVTNGGGTVESGASANATTDADGIATVTDWTIGGTAGANALEVTSGALTPVSFAATGQTAAFDIVVRLYGDTTKFTAGAKAAFAAAEARWEALIFGDLENVSVNYAAGDIPCDTTLPAINEVVDDVVIYAKIETIDGVGGILGSAGPCLIRSGGTHPSLPPVGRMRFDSADVATLESNGSLNLVIQHEMAHVLGYGTLWNQSPFSLLTGAGGADPYFTGAQAIAAFDRVGGTAYVASPKVPVENTGGAGTRDGHWRESVFDRELMTGFLDSGANPLSIVSLGSFWDMNYLVNYADADAFAWPSPPALVSTAWELEMKDDVGRWPIIVIDRDGRVVRVIQP